MILTEFVLLVNLSFISTYKSLKKAALLEITIRAIKGNEIYIMYRPGQAICTFYHHRQCKLACPGLQRKKNTFVSDSNSKNSYTFQLSKLQLQPILMNKCQNCQFMSNQETKNPCCQFRFHSVLLSYHNFSYLMAYFSQHFIYSALIA